MNDSAHLLTPAEAARIIIDSVRPLSTETVPLADAQGRVPTADITSPIDVPPWDNSAMDGYAANAGDVRVSGELEVVDTIPAGAHADVTIERGTCARIFTGAPVPSGIDTVVRQEDVTSIGSTRIRITDDRDRGRNVRPKGEDCRSGSVVARAGFDLQAGALGMLASTGHAAVEVHAVPTVALMVSGDEIADVDQTDAIVRGEKIGSSNTHTMAALARSAGARVRFLGIAKDDPQDVRSRLDQAEGADLLVTSAGMSVGDHDHLRRLLEESGGANQFWRLRSRPGAPVGFGSWNEVPWIGLPGNPVSTVVTFHLFASPAIRQLRGLLHPFRRPLMVRLAEQTRTPGKLQHFVRVRLEESDDGFVAHPTGPQGSGLLSSVAAADALLMIPEDCNEAEAGEMFPALVLSDDRYGAEIPY